MKVVSGAMVPFDALEDNADVQEILDCIGDSLTRSQLTARDDYDAAYDTQETRQ